jgi:hypothetical protein
MVVSSASARTTGFASRGSSYTKVQRPILSERFPVGACTTTVPEFFPFLVGSIETSGHLALQPQGPVNPLLKYAAPGLLKWAFYDHEDLRRVLFPLIQDRDSVG